MNYNKLSIQRREVIQRLSLITGYDVAIVRDIINAETEFVLDEIRNGTSVRIGNLGELIVSQRQLRQGYDFKKKQAIAGTKTVNMVKFHASAALKRAIKGLE
jgi:nucleoid DNA-binding protein